MSSLEPPILVLGAARSGTTLVAESLLARHPAVAYWPEPVFVWRYGNAYRSTDILGPRHATPAVKEYIRRRFGEYTRDRGAERFVGKTPSNCLRVPFLLEVFPDARIVHVLPDGRDAARSTAEEWAGPGQRALEHRELREGGRLKQAWRGLATWLRLGERVDDLRSFLELPAYAGRFVGFLARHLLRTDAIPWGPRFPGLWKLRQTLSLLETCAVQWMVCVEMARSGSAHLPADQYLEIRYEDLVGDPRSETERLLEFVELSADEEVARELSDGVVRRTLPVWPDRLSAREVRSMERYCAGTLRSLGYSTIEDGELAHPPSAYPA